MSKAFTLLFHFWLLGTFATGCTTSPETRRIWISDSDYRQVSLQNTLEKQAYSGFQNVLDVKITRMTSEVREAMTLKKATNFQWSEVETQKERESQRQKSSEATEFFMSFFTPESKNDNLAKADTVWRVFLDVDGRRFPGVVSKVLDTPSEIQDLYPAHTRWGTPYVVKFLVPTSIVESMNSKLTITGPVASAELNFSGTR